MTIEYASPLSERKPFKTPPRRGLIFTCAWFFIALYLFPSFKKGWTPTIVNFDCLTDAKTPLSMKLAMQLPILGALAFSFLAYSKTRARARGFLGLFIVAAAVLGWAIHDAAESDLYDDMLAWSSQYSARIGVIDGFLHWREWPGLQSSLIFSAAAMIPLGWLLARSTRTHTSSRTKTFIIPLLLPILIYAIPMFPAEHGATGVQLIYNGFTHSYGFFGPLLLSVFFFLQANLTIGAGVLLMTARLKNGSADGLINLGVLAAAVSFIAGWFAMFLATSHYVEWQYYPSLAFTVTKIFTSAHLLLLPLALGIADQIDSIQLRKAGVIDQ